MWAILYTQNIQIWDFCPLVVTFDHQDEKIFLSDPLKSDERPDVHWGWFRWFVKFHKNTVVSIFGKPM